LPGPQRCGAHDPLDLNARCPQHDAAGIQLAAELAAQQARIAAQYRNPQLMSFRPHRAAQPTPRRPVAPVHRGPQAVTQQTVGTHTVHHAPNAALLIDFDNVTMGIRSDLQTELKNLLSSDIVKGKVSVQRAYADWRRYPQYIVPLSESSIDLIFAPAYGSAKKNATDIRLAIDALELVFVRPEIGTFILLSGDSDFSSLVIKLKEYGKYVIGVGIRESSSDLLVQNCDEYYSYNALAGLVKSGEEEIIKRDPWELVTDAVQQMKRNGDVMRADRLKQVMQQIDSTFDEKNYGKSKFSLFVAEAAKRGLISLTKLENGQLEVDIAHGPPTPATDEAGTLPAGQETEKPPRREGRAGRPERGRRGRGREERTPRPARGDTDGAHPAAAAPSAEKQAPTPAPAAVNGVGTSGLRLTRDEAFDLVRRSVDQLKSGARAVPASQLRTTARSLLGRDSESLSERNFTRILQDAHDADLIDLRRRGSDYEVASSAAADSVSSQLGAAEAAATPATTKAAPVQRGMSARGIGRGSMRGKGGAPPPHILSVGVVASRAAAASPANATESSAASTVAAPSSEAPSVAVAQDATEEAPRRTGRKRGVAAKKTSRGKSAATETSAGEPKAAAPRKRNARGGRKKATVATPAESAGE
jgi:uncharacterized protein (TIGR00288 family)